VREKKCIACVSLMQRPGSGPGSRAAAAFGRVMPLHRSPREAFYAGRNMTGNVHFSQPENAT
jgi:hypothetical protein